MYIGGWGGESNREVVSFRSCVRASERARDQRFDCVARAVVRPVYVLCCCGQNHAGRVVHEKCCFRTGFFRFLADNLRKTNVNTSLFADNLIKPV